MGGFGQAPFGAFPYGMAATESEIANWRPAQNESIPRLSVVEFDVLNSSWDEVESAVRAVFGNGSVETVWSNETGFSELYRRGSARKSCPGGHHYVLRRTTGWIGALFKVDVLMRDEPVVIPPTPPQTIPDGAIVIGVGNLLMSWNGALIITSPFVDEPIMPYRVGAIGSGSNRLIVCGGSVITTPV
jgi:hypothetical protein